jgi:hypothetical protein
MSDGGGRRRADAHWSETSYEEARRDESGGTQWSEVRRSERPALGSTQAALPASPAEPASRWTSGMSTGSSGREHAGSSSSGREYGSGSSSGAGSSSGGREYGGREYGGGREDERGSRRSRSADDDDDYGWNGGRDEHRSRSARQIVDFEGSDDRWR